MCHIRSNFLFNLTFFPLLFGPFLFFYFILFFHRVVQAQLSCPHKIGLSFHVLDEVHLQTKAPNRKRIASVCFGALRDQRKWSMAIYAITGLNNFSMECSWKQQRKSVKQRSQYLEVVLVWPTVRYISDIGQYWCIVSSLPQNNIYIYIY